MNNKTEKFEDLIVWQKTELLTINIYKNFRSLKDYSFRDQIQRAAISIMNNIAEGFERKGNKELKQFLYFAKGSSGEVRSMLYAAVKLGYISRDDFKSLYKQAFEISKMLSGFIKTL